MQGEVTWLQPVSLAWLWLKRKTRRRVSPSHLVPTFRHVIWPEMWSCCGEFGAAVPCVLCPCRYHRCLFNLLLMLCLSEGALLVHSFLAPQEWIYQLPYQTVLQSLIRSQEVMSSLSCSSFPMLFFWWKPGNRHCHCDSWQFLETCPFTLSVLL